MDALTIELTYVSKYGSCTVEKSVVSHKSDRNAVTVTDDHPVHYHQTFLNERNLAAGTGLKLFLNNAQFKILIIDQVSWVHQQLIVHILVNVDEKRL